MIGNDYPKNWRDDKDEWYADVEMMDLTGIENISRRVPVMQFTGLKDKNGKRIYEGDLFSCIYSRDGHLDHLYEVVWYEGQAAFRSRRHGNACPQMQVVQTVEDAARNEVIGNIYENPELLKTN